MKTMSCLLLAVAASLAIGFTEQAEPPQPYLVVIWQANAEVTTVTTPTTSITTPTTTAATTETTLTTIPTTTIATTTTTRRPPFTTRTTTVTTDITNPTTDATNPTTDVTNSTTDVTGPTTDITNSTTDITNSTTEATTTVYVPPTEAPVTIAARMVYASDKHKYRTLYGTGKLLAVVAGVEHAAVCTGALVTQQYVLTSATCAERLSPGDVITTADLVNLGDVDVADFHTIDRVIPYGNTALNNVALLRLKEDMGDSADVVGWGITRAMVDANCYSSFWDISGSEEQKVENRTVTPCYEQEQRPEHICSASSIVFQTPLEEREGAVLVCDDLVAGIFSYQLNDPEVTTLMKYQEISIYSQWITKIVSAASFVNVSFTAFLAMAVIVAVTAF